jgi:hypothetical protein
MDLIETDVAPDRYHNKETTTDGTSLENVVAKGH